MKLLNCPKTKVMLIGFVAAIMLGGGGRAKADFTFGEPKNLGPTINSSSNDEGLTISADGLSLFFGSDRPDRGDWDLYVVTRETIEDEWGPAANLGPIVNTPQSEGYPSISADGLELFFCSIYWQSQRPGGSGRADLWVTRRASVFDPWGTPENLGPLVNSASHESEPSISADGLSLYFSSDRSGGEGDFDLYVTTRPTKNNAWGTPMNLGPIVNSTTWDMNPNISSDGLALFFRSPRPGGYGSSDIYLTRRATTSESWGEPVNLGPIINTSATQVSHYISPDGSTLYLDTGGTLMGRYDLWQVRIIPIVDLNSDNIVDAADMCIIVDNWRTDEPLCDIGPTPLGDGIVDVQDLIVLAEHLFEEPGLVAHWPLDEAQGNIAYDYTGICDGTLLGNPVWQPAGGMVDGAIQLDGLDDFIFISSIPNLIKGPFSVFAWVKGGAPGQVVISQRGGVNWLCAYTLEGNLMTELKGTSGGATILPSQAVITDGNWHRIGFVWDGSHRMLYVDNVAVAEDTQDNLEVSENRLYLGTGKDLKSGTYWSGLIDDVRIYNRAVIP